MLRENAESEKVPVAGDSVMGDVETSVSPITYVQIYGLGVAVVRGRSAVEGVVV
jgi:hypothetical protein